MTWMHPSADEAHLSHLTVSTYDRTFRQLIRHVNSTMIMAANPTVKSWVQAASCSAVAILLLASCHSDASNPASAALAAALKTRRLSTRAIEPKHVDISLHMPRTSLGSQSSQAAVLRRPLQVSAPALPAVIMQACCIQLYVCMDRDCALCRASGPAVSAPRPTCPLACRRQRPRLRRRCHLQRSCSSCWPRWAPAAPLPTKTWR